MEIIAYIVGAFIGLLLCIPIWIAYMVGFVMEGIAFTKFAKLKPVKCLWFVWVPTYIEYVGKKYLMLQMSDENEFKLFGGKLVFKNKMTPFWIYLGVYCACVLISLVSLCLAWIPFVGLVIVLLECVIIIPAIVVLEFIEYAYFRDMLNAINPDPQANNVVTAVWVTVANIVSFGLARAIVLLVLANKVTAELPE